MALCGRSRVRSYERSHIFRFWSENCGRVALCNVISTQFSIGIGKKVWLSLGFLSSEFGSEFIRFLYFIRKRFFMSVFRRIRFWTKILSDFIRTCSEKKNPMGLFPSDFEYFTDFYLNWLVHALKVSTIEKRKSSSLNCCQNNSIFTFDLMVFPRLFINVYVLYIICNYWSIFNIVNKCFVKRSLHIKI